MTLPPWPPGVNDYNGEGRWAAREILARYVRYAGEAGVQPPDILPKEHFDPRLWHRWVYPVMDRVIEGIEAGDPACIRLGIEFIEEDEKFPFGKILKSNAARALRRAALAEPQKQRIRARVFEMLRAGHVPREYREYAKLVRKIGFDVADVPSATSDNPYVARFRKYFLNAVARRPSP